MVIRVVVAEGDRDFNSSIGNLLNRDRSIKLVGKSLTGLDTISLTMRHRPNVLILSTNLPDMDIISIVNRIMKQYPTPILVLYRHNDTSLLKKLRNMKIGIIDFLPITVRGSKNSISDVSLITRLHILSKLNVERFGEQIRQGIAQTRSRRVSRISRNNSVQTKRVRRAQSSIQDTKTYSGTGRSSKIIIIGSSTGGPRLLSEVVPSFPKNMPPIVIVQHMPVGFIQPFASRLNRLSSINVITAETGSQLLPGKVYLAPGGKHLEFNELRNTTKLLLTDGPPVNYVKPAVDVTLESAVKIYGSGVISVILTGMGSDGLEGSRAVKQSGGKVLALSKEDADIYGMNRAVIEAGITDKILSKKELVVGIIRAIEGKI